jgi:transposase
VPIAPTPAPLPNDVDALKRLVVEQQAQIEHMKLLIAKLRRMKFGRSSEQFSREIEQLELRLEELQTVHAQMAPVEEAAAQPQRGKPARKPLPEHLPREQVVHQPACVCPDCGVALRRIGEDVAEVLEYVPEHFKVVRHVRPKLSCPSCQRIVQADAPSRPIARGLAGSGLLAHVLVAKYADHLPLYRQAEIYARQGIDLVSLIGVKEPGKIGVMAPVEWGETDIPAGSRMRGFRRVGNLRFGRRWRQFRRAVRLAVEHEAVGVVA